MKERNTYRERGERESVRKREGEGEEESRRKEEKIVTNQLPKQTTCRETVIKYQ